MLSSSRRIYLSGAHWFPLGLLLWLLDLHNSRPVDVGGVSEWLLESLWLKTWVEWLVHEDELPLNLNYYLI
jgi:hypothetical protein